MKGFCLEVTGKYACFTRPEMKVERVSYDIITPSAARGIFTAVFWKPAILWQITKIEVLNPIRWTTIRRNEVGTAASPKSKGIFIEEDRQQRAGLLLRDVAYRLYAEFEFNLDKTATLRPDDTPAKYASMFERRAEKGQYFMHPYLGCREFSCDTIRLIRSPETETLQPIAEDREFGFMLYDMDYSDHKNISPMYYKAVMKQGVITVPHRHSEEVYK